MTPAPVTDLQQIARARIAGALARPCPTCQAQPRKTCRAPSGYATAPHTRRYPTERGRYPE